MIIEQWLLVVLVPALVLFATLWAGQRAMTRAAEEAGAWKIARLKELYAEAQKYDREMIATYRKERDAAEARADAANNRLLMAWKDGYTVPQTGEGEMEPELEKLPQPVTEWLEQWEDPQARARWEVFFRGKLGRGRSVEAALADAELKMVQGQENLARVQE